MRNMSSHPQISVVGASSPRKNARETAFEVGRLIAEGGGVLFSGGLGGVMEEASRGAKEAGGMVVGILPTYEHHHANPYVNVIIPTGLNRARNVLVVACGQAVIAVDGSYGTLSEIALALNIGRPVAGLLLDWEIPGVYIAENPKEAVDWAFTTIGGAQPGE